MENHIEKQVPFINRVEELERIETLINEWGTQCWVFVHAAGGIGKTRLLQEVRGRSSSTTEYSNLRISNILDFDDKDLHLGQNLARQIARIDEKTFAPYFQASLDFHRMEIAGISQERLKEERSALNTTFVKCFNDLSAHQRVVLLLDTFEVVQETDFANYLFNMGKELRNAVFLIAGRTTRTLYQTLQSTAHSVDLIDIIELQPLKEEDSATFLQQKQEAIFISLEPDIASKLLFLADGLPILLDLAVDWRAHGISLAWLIETDLETLQALPDEELAQRRKEFKKQLVAHLTNTETMMDWLILTLARVYPMDVAMIASLLSLSTDEAQELFDDALSYVFVKQRSDDKISLHDEMRDMVLTYVWPVVDPQGERQRENSRLAADYLQTVIQQLETEIEATKKTEKASQKSGDQQQAFDAFTARDRLERDLWFLKIDRLEHLLFADSNRGFQAFKHLFDEAGQMKLISFRRPLFIAIQDYIKQLSPDQQYEVLKRRVRHLLDEGEYQTAENIVSDLLAREHLAASQRIEVQIDLANIHVRMGRLPQAIEDFAVAVALSEEQDDVLLTIQTKNGLGWAYRLIGEYEQAIALYNEARDLCLEHEILDDTYGWVLNNLTFAMSYQDRRNAINFGKSALEHWETLGNPVGEGAAHQVLGMVYYQNGLYDEALEELNEALRIFEVSQLPDLKARTLSWRGAVYQGMERHDDAEKDFLESLRIGPPNIRAMTLSRLGRVFMSRKQWDKAREQTRESYDISKTQPDYTYWIAALGRLITIDAEQHISTSFEQYERETQEFLDNVSKPDGNALGIAYFGLARLALGNGAIEKTIHYLEQGIRQAVAYGMYASTGVVDRLNFVERDFGQVEPAIIRAIGQRLKEIFKQEHVMTYSIVTPVLYKWAKWENKAI
jgi:tetratricopeptide (TPR) repeat protein